MRRCCSFSGPVQVDVAAKDEENGELMAAAEIEEADESREEEEDENERWIMKRGCSTLFIRKRLTGGRKKQGGQRMIIQPLGRLDFRDGY
mgnify:CR=1 FL=1